VVEASVNRSVRSLFLVCLAALTTAAPARDQMPRAERAISHVERARDVVEGVRERVGGCMDVRARASLDAASRMQDRAEAAIRSGRYLGALQLADGARDRALVALRICGLRDEPAAAADRALRRTDDLLARAARSAGPGWRGGREALARAEEAQRQAWTEQRAGHVEEALRLTQSARALARRVLRVAGPVR
jgi:hypothetical protein